MLEIKNLSVGFVNQSNTLIPIIEKLNFFVKPEETLGIVGESGSGKSLTALSIMGLIEEIGAYHIGGSICINGKNIISLSKEEKINIRGKVISIIFQDPYASFNPMITIGKHMDDMLIAHSELNKKQRKQKNIELLELVNIYDAQSVYKKYPHQLSGGMLQRVMIAIAISSNPQVIIADEITTALDVSNQKEIIKLLKTIQKKYQLSLVFISHDISLVSNIADRTMVMYAGHIVEIGKTKEVFSKPHHPYTKALLKTLPENNTNNAKLEYIPGTMPGPEDKPQGCPFNPRCKYKKNWCEKEFPAMIDISSEHSSRCILPINQ
jgi:oligopeptide/dipeptide ABC transporter ATP-binding protein